MHPPLDRPHPDCQDVIESLRACHANHAFKKYLGACNTIKAALDECLRLEKKRLLDEINQDLPQRKLRQEEIIKEAFGKTMTFSEYLNQDADYQEAKKKASTHQS